MAEGQYLHSCGRSAVAYVKKMINKKGMIAMEPVYHDGLMRVSVHSLEGRPEYVQAKSKIRTKL